MDYEITPQEVARRRAAGEELVLLDVREHWERGTASIADSLHMPMDEVPSRMQELDPDAAIVVVCHHGMRSLAVTDFLRKQGYEAVQSLAGGIQRWSVEVDPKVPRY
ncbi:MAG: rhodanese-like domain-containing protein [Acidobacteriota bacterium]|nr:rhodanese-like domain-containing protein [Acidobacteriota bacterium]